MPKSAAPTPSALAAEAVRRMRAMADPAKARFAQKYFKEPLTCYGLTAHEMRVLSDELHLAVKGAWSVGEAVAFCEALLRHTHHEARGAGIILLLKYKKDFPKSLFGRIKTWLARDYCDNWALVDLLCPEALGALIDGHPGLAKTILAWTRHPNRWVKRGAIVAFIKPARKGRFLDEAYAVSEAVFPSGDDLLEKAGGWMLREAGKTDPQRLRAFLLKHGPAVPRTTLRYALEKFPQAERLRLMKATKRPLRRTKRRLLTGGVK